MNIGFDAKRAFNNKTGLGYYSRWVMNSLSEYYPENNYYAYTPRINPEVMVNGEQNITVRMPRSWFHRTFHQFWRTLALPSYLKNDNIEVYHGLSNELPSSIGMSSKIRKIVTIHDLIFLRYPAYYNFMDRKIYLKKVKHACDTADVIIAISEYTANDLVNILGIPRSKIQVVYQNCPDVYKQVFSENAIQQVKQKYFIKNPYLLCVSTIEPRKNQELLVKAFDQIEDKDLSLVIVGKDESYYALQLKEYLHKRKLEERVKIVSYVQVDDLPKLYQGATGFVFPSKIEGLGLPVLEALHSKVPVLTTAGTSMQEIAQNAALYYEKDNLHDLQKQLHTLVYDSTVRSTLIHNAAQQVALFDSQKLCQQMINIYTN